MKKREVNRTAGVALASLIVVGSLHALARAQPRREPRIFTQARQSMVEQEIVAAGVKDERVIEAMKATPRHEFVAAGQRKWAYLDMALPIGAGQTISPPFVVAYMTEALDPQPEDKVLEIGTGSGYQAAVLSPLVKEVYTIEIVESLGRTAANTLARLNYQNVYAKTGDGYQGWPEHGPFDKIIVTCSPESVPQPLVDQLAEGGRMVIPVGERYQQTLYLYRKKAGELEQEKLLPTLFVPMTGTAEEQREKLPDGSRPTIQNGDFEEYHGTPPKPSGWHYQRQATLVTEEAPEGNQYVRFANEQPGRGAQMLQGMAVDGRQVAAITIRLLVKTGRAAPGGTRQQMPMVVVTFYDENRADAGTGWLGPWTGTHPWTPVEKTIPVPIHAREAILRIGLHGAVGSISFDAVQLQVLPRF